MNITCSAVIYEHRMAYGLSPPTPHHHPNWDLEMSPMYPSSLTTLYPRQQHDTFASPPPFSIATSIIIKQGEKNTPLSLNPMAWG